MLSPVNIASVSINKLQSNNASTFCGKRKVDSFEAAKNPSKIRRFLAEHKTTIGALSLIAGFLYMIIGVYNNNNPADIGAGATFTVGGLKSIMKNRWVKIRNDVLRRK